MNTRWLVPSLLLLAAACGKPDDQNPPPKEICGNASDDDGNGFADCTDPACAGHEVCLIVEKQCAVQADCLARDGTATQPKQYDDYINDPIPLCIDTQCVRPAASIDVFFEIKTSPSYNGCCTINSVNTRFIKKTAIDGTPVTCATVAEVASSKQAADADQIEKSQKFNLQAYDVTSTSQAYAGGSTIVIPSMSVSTGGDFIIWTELWSDKKDSNNNLPRGFRYGWACLESGTSVQELTTAHDGQAVKVTMPAPQGL